MAVLFTVISGLLRGFVSDFEKSWELWALGWMREQSSSRFWGVEGGFLDWAD